MRAYKVSAEGMFRYAGTQADARAARDEIVEALGCKKKDVEIEEAEIPTGKEGLLEFVNDLAELADVTDSDEDEEDDDDEEE